MGRIKSREDENLTDSNIEKVIKLLRGEKPITKKAACSLLNISYNTTRLDNIIVTYEERQAHLKKMYESKKGKPPEKSEIAFIIQEYLGGGNITSVSKDVFRTTEFVEKILVENGVPIRKSNDYTNPVIIPDASVKRDFALGEVCYSAKYLSLATIELITESREGDPVYRIWLSDESQKQFAYQPWWELMSLTQLVEKYGVKF